LIEAFSEANPCFEWHPKFKPYDQNCELDEMPEALAAFKSYVSTIPTRDGEFLHGEGSPAMPTNVTLFLVDLRNDGPFRLSAVQGPERYMRFKLLIAQVNLCN
jgi:hypothetical protein